MGNEQAFGRMRVLTQVLYADVNRAEISLCSDVINQLREPVDGHCLRSALPVFRSSLPPIRLHCIPLLLAPLASPYTVSIHSLLLFALTGPISRCFKVDGIANRPRQDRPGLYMHQKTVHFLK